MLKPRLVFSACLNLEKTRYDGKLIENSIAIKLRNFCDIISVCPEIGIGLPVPREKIILYKENEEIKAVEIFTGKDFTKKLISFSTNFIKNLPEVEGFFLKSKSPSCGVSYKTKTYKDIKGEILIDKTQGIFAKEILNAFPFIPVVDEEILKDKDNLENFLIRIWALRRLRELKENAQSKEDIIEFHKKSYYLLMSYDSSNLSEIENILLFWNISFEKLLKMYEEIFKKILAKPFSREKQINVILYILEKFSKDLKEKKQIFYLLERYKKREIPLIDIIVELKNLFQRIDKEELSFYFYLEPYPDELKELFELI